ncbi:hypothetical protein L5515_016500 [Caenorhabditis briggsae]|uniref:Uncharacterized protein n=1 Tax=Caenorhabditis briggsae TaxID=6238 RepID=A0AAE8ZP02_CAEBR|nr:hypothetical protein L3Y34_010611 [Caenorhabditis briggsae]UMM39436.1 hypothetical protein L5515_016500 [Caenorhabditis briggsae]
MPTAAEELLLKLGYSKFALDSEVITEDMFDEIFEPCVSSENDENENPVIFQTDGNSSSSSSSFETKPTFSKTCN